MPRLLTAFAKKVVSMERSDLIAKRLRKIRNEVLADLRFPQLSISDILKFLVIFHQHIHY